MKNVTSEPELLPAPNQPTYQEPEQKMMIREDQPNAVTSLSILDAAVRGGINKDNVEVVERLVALRRDEVALQNKSAFNRSFFALKREISTMNFYADKEAKTKSGEVAYSYCSETEIAGKLEPVLFKHGFAMLFGQRQETDRVVAIVTLIHELGHEETREYSVRVGQSNQMKDSTAVDAGSTTSAWRHLVIKMFGLKSRIRAEDDARNEGEFITQAQAEELEHRLKMVNGDVAKFLAVAGAKKFAEIRAGKYATLTEMLWKKENPKL